LMASTSLMCTFCVQELRIEVVKTRMVLLTSD
jgi:hypothetical protein